MTQEELNNGGKWLWRVLMVASTALIVLLIMASCTKRIYVPVQTTEVRTDTLRAVEVWRDTVINSDTVRIEARGDTVLMERTKWRIRIKQTHDTVYRAKCDTVYKEKPYPVEVEKKQSWFDKWRDWIVLVLLWAIPIIGIIWEVAKRIKKR